MEKGITRNSHPRVCRNSVRVTERVGSKARATQTTEPKGKSLLPGLFWSMWNGENMSDKSSHGLRDSYVYFFKNRPFFLPCVHKSWLIFFFFFFLLGMILRLQPILHLALRDNTCRRAIVILYFSFVFFLIS